MPSPEQRQQVEVLKAFATTLPTDSPALPGVMTAIEKATAERVEFTAPIEVAVGDLHHPGDQRFIEVSYACTCVDKNGKAVGLAKTPEELPGAWAAHVREKTGLSEDLLLAHALVSLYGQRATARCACGQEFQASDKDPTDPGAAVHGWADHVRLLA